MTAVRICKPFSHYQRGDVLPDVQRGVAEEWVRRGFAEPIEGTRDPPPPFIIRKRGRPPKWA